MKREAVGLLFSLGHQLLWYELMDDKIHFVKDLKSKLSSTLK